VSTQEKYKASPQKNTATNENCPLLSWTLMYYLLLRKNKSKHGCQNIVGHDDALFPHTCTDVLARVETIGPSVERVWATLREHSIHAE